LNFHSFNGFCMVSTALPLLADALPAMPDL
jgi:hypothetical protein